MNSKIQKKCQNIKLVLTDVDGVLTDGGMYYTENGDTMKKFHVRDGMGVSLLKKNNIPTIIVTKEKNKIIKQWAKNMPIAKLFDGVQDKKSILEIVCKTYSVKKNEVAFIGDDINDLELLKSVGFSMCPNDAIELVKTTCDYVCSKNGGNAVFRELSDLLLYKKT